MEAVFSTMILTFSISPGVVTTAPMGNPLPMPFAIVTISGITSYPWKPQKWLPVRPNPVWTCQVKSTSLHFQVKVFSIITYLLSSLSRGISTYVWSKLNLVFVSNLIRNADSSSFTHKFVRILEVVFRVLYSTSHSL